MTTSGAPLAKSQVYLNAVEALGFRPRIDDDGDVAFRMEGRSLMVMADEDDRGFFRALMPYFWRIDSAEELTRARQVALQLTSEYKAVKVFVLDDYSNVSASVELFFDEPAGVLPVLERCLVGLLAASREFGARMRGDLDS